MKVLEKQLWHLISLVILIYGITVLVNNSTLDGEFWGITTKSWLIYSVGIAIVHQVYVLIIWRLELYYSLISKIFGKAGFTLYAVGFSIMFILRLLFIIALGISSKNSMALNPVISYSLAILLSMIVIYLLYSVLRYFGFKRAYGIDHFDRSFGDLPFVKKGIFRFSNNAMYKFGLLILWIPGLLLFSKPALIAALFQHIYIWVHYYFTELPDMKHIYGKVKL
ncbi:MAG: methyltransferase [Candidatus Cloacimonadota bacterium]|nr:methyltransferase [Candidatus Cloacimonadota bacterium]